MSFIPDFSAPPRFGNRIPDDDDEVEKIEWSMVAREQDLQSLKGEGLKKIAGEYGLRTTLSKRYLIENIVRYERSRLLREYRQTRTESFLAGTYGDDPARLISVSTKLARFIHSAISSWQEVSKVRLGTEAAPMWIGRSVQAREKLALVNRLLKLATAAQPGRYDYVTGRYETTVPLGISAVKELREALMVKLLSSQVSGSLWTHAKHEEERQAVAEFIQEVLS